MPASLDGWIDRQLETHLEQPDGTIAADCATFLWQRRTQAAWDAHLRAMHILVQQAQLHTDTATVMATGAFMFGPTGITLRVPLRDESAPFVVVAHPPDDRPAPLEIQTDVMALVEDLEARTTNSQIHTRREQFDDALSILNQAGIAGLTHIQGIGDRYWPDLCSALSEQFCDLFTAWFTDERIRIIHTPDHYDRPAWLDQFLTRNVRVYWTSPISAKLNFAHHRRHVQIEI